MADVQGVDELVKKLKTLPDEVQRKGGRKAMTAAGKPVLKESKVRVPVRTGLLKQSLANKVIKLSSGDYAVLTGARRLKGTKKKPKAGFKITKKVQKQIDALGLAEINPTRYAHLVELGTPHSPAHSFLRTGLKAAESASERETQRVLTEVIEKAAEA